MMPFLKQSTRNKQAAPPFSPARTQGNKKRTKTTGTSSLVPNATDTPAEATATTTALPPDTPSTIPNNRDSSWITVKSKATLSSEEKQKKVKLSTKCLLDSDSDSDEEERDLVVTVPEINHIFLLTQYSVSSRFSITFDIDATLEPDKFLLTTVSKMNTILKNLTIDGQLAGYSGRAVMIPWEDTEVYSNRAVKKIKKHLEHTKLLVFLHHYLYGYGAPKGRKQDKTVSCKYCRMNIAWVSRNMILDEKRESLLCQYWTSKKLSEPDSFYILPAPTESINPTIVVQFRQSILTNPSNWSDKGHEDCLEELNSMIKSFLPPTITTAGLKKVTFATGQNFIRGDPSMLSLECEKRMKPWLLEKCFRFSAPSIARYKSETRNQYHGSLSPTSKE